MSVFSDAALPAGARAGMPRLILTQDADGAAGWLELCRQAGLAACNWPAFRIHALAAQTIVTRLLAALDAGGRPAPRVVVLPSPAAVRVLAGALEHEGMAWPDGVWAGVPGSGTAGVFRQHFGDAIRLLCPPPPMQDGAHLALRLLDALRDAPASRVVVCNRPDGRRDWLAALTQAGIGTQVVPVYQVTTCATLPAGMADALAGWQQGEHAVQWVVGAGASLRTVAGWLDALPGALAAWGLVQRLWLPHPVLLDEARGLGFTRPVVFRDRQSLIERIQSAEP